MYAIAVRDADVLRLVKRIRRDVTGDVYLLSPGDHWKAGWNPHASYHATGRSHQKSFNYAAMARDRQPPTGNFRGTENLDTFGVATDEVRTIGIRCEPEQFDAVFELPVEELRPERYRTIVSVDLTEPGGAAIITSTMRIVRQTAFDDAIPWTRLERTANPSSAITTTATSI